MENTKTNPSPSPNPNPNPNRPEVEIRLFVRGKKRVEVFKSALGGWNRDRLEVQRILDEFGLELLRVLDGDEIRFCARDGRSFGRYGDGDLVVVVGEPKDNWSMIKTISIVALVLVFILIVAVGVVSWIQNMRSSNGKIPSWMIASVVIVVVTLKNRKKRAQ